MIRASSGSVTSTASTNRSTASTASTSPSSSVSRVYPARSAKAIATRRRPEVDRVAVEVGLHVADDVLLDEVLEVALVDLVHDRRGQRQQLAGSATPSARPISTPVAPDAHQRLVDVEVKQPHLGVGDLRDRLAVDAHELEQGDQRKPGVEHGGDIAQQLQLVLGTAPAACELTPRPAMMPLDQRRLEPGLRAAASLERVALGLGSANSSSR